MRSKKLTALGLSACMVFSTLCVPAIEAGAASVDGIRFTTDAFGDFVVKYTAESAAAVVGTQVWKRNSLASILAGTILYMVLVRAVF